MALQGIGGLRGLLAFRSVQLASSPPLELSTLLLPRNCPKEKKTRKNKSENADKTASKA